MSALFLRKSACHQKTSSTQTTSRHYDKKNPERAIFEFFLIKLQQTNRATSRQDPPAPCSKYQEAQGLQPDGCTFLQKSTHHSKVPRSATRFHSRKHSDDVCYYSSRPEKAKRDFQSSTMKCSGTCRYETHRIPRKGERRYSSTRILPM